MHCGPDIVAGITSLAQPRTLSQEMKSVRREVISLETIDRTVRQSTRGGGCHMAPDDQVDGRVNRRQTSGVIELSEQTVIEQLVVRLTSRYPTISESTVSSVVRDVHARYDGRPLRDFVPLFVERHAKSELERLSTTPG
jgi:hypothetical protein